jgi:hypothetical protein
VPIAVGYGCPGRCNADQEGFSNQIIRAAWMLKFSEQRSEGNIDWAIIKNTTVDASGNPWVSHWDNSDDPQSCYGGSMTQGTWSRGPSQCGATTYYDGYITIDGTSIHIDNGATAALYRYTPYFSGNQSFFTIFTNWFGSTHAFVYKGLNYSSVFDPEYYLDNNADLKAAFGDNQIEAFNHFVYYGMNEGRVASSNFDVTSYRNRYSDLRWAFGTDLPAYYSHYITNGQYEGRIATGTIALQPVTSYAGVDYSTVYDFSTYMTDNQDLRNLYGASTDDTDALRHFINYGMSEGRKASVNFDVRSYQLHYYDLRRAFGDNLKAYYMHYITNGKTEGRIATGDYLGGTTVLNGFDYSAVYIPNDFEAFNADIKIAFGLNDIAALQHFVNYGMNEGRLASSGFNVYTYKARYVDLQAAFGNNLKAYYMHYITNGKAEGRSGI